MKKVTVKRLESKLKKLKHITFDGHVVVIILGTLLKKAKRIQREVKKKDLNSIKLHDLNVQSRTIRELIDEMLIDLSLLSLKRELQRKKKANARKK